MTRLSQSWRESGTPDVRRYSDEISPSAASTATTEAKRHSVAEERCALADAGRVRPTDGGTRLTGWKPVLRAIVVFLAISTFARSSFAADAPIVIDPAVRLQTFQGWGTSLCWWAKVAGGYPDADRERIMNQVFDPKDGLGFNVVRYNIGGGENPKNTYLSFRAAVPGYEPAPGKWDWTADANQRWVLTSAIRHGANQLEAFSNSPPWWMTKSESVTGNDGGAENLKPDQFPAFALYLSTVVKHFHDQWGVTFRDVDPLNEPCSNWWTKGKWQEGCKFDRPAQSKIIELLDAELKKQRSTTTVAASDENSIDDAVSSFDALTDPARKAISKINTHSYNGSKRADLNRRATDARKDLWMSEYGDNDPTGLVMADRIVLDMQKLRPSAWVIWQVADPAGGWGLFRSALRDETRTDWKINEKFYVMGNFSRFIRPGAILLNTADPHTLAAFNPTNRSLTLVVVNTDKSDREIAFDLTKVKPSVTSVQSYRTSMAESLAREPAIPLKARMLTAVIPAKSVQTFVINGCSIPEPARTP